MRVLCNGGGGGGSCSTIGAGAEAIIGLMLIFLFIFMGVVMVVVVVVSRMILDIGEGVVVVMSGTGMVVRCAQRCSWNSRLMR